MSYGLRIGGLILAVTTACSGSTTPGSPLTPCNGNLSVDVSGGLTPTVSWAPQCGLNRFRVDELDAAAGVSATAWDVSASTELFGSPVRYGATPDGAVATSAAAKLKAGGVYRVTVFRAGGEAIILSSGTATFTP